jgi:hypothetical protein
MFQIKVVQKIKTNFILNNVFEFYVQVTVHRDKFRIKQPTIIIIQYSVWRQVQSLLQNNSST